MGTGQLVERIESVVIASAGVGELTSALGDLNRVDGWVSVKKAAITRRLAELEAAGAAPPASDVLARSGHTSSRQAAKDERRANAYGNVPEMGKQRAAGRISDEHADALANAAGKLDDEQRAELFSRGDELAERAAASTPGQFAHQLSKIANGLSTDDEAIDRSEQQREQASLSHGLNDTTGLGWVRADLSAFAIEPDPHSPAWPAEPVTAASRISLPVTLPGMNRLADETSPYLRQHRDNPVDWYAWGPDAFAAAKERNVPILLSVGYSACHWCHVMAHECFEDAEVGAKMNELFVNIKVDREERPDVDALYMEAVQAMTGRGGWPMTVFLTPDREPFYGGTYFPKDAFLKLLDAINGPEGIFTTRQADVAKNVNQLVQAISKSAELKAGTELPDVEQLNNAVQGLGKAFDPEWGGFGKAPKFPSTFNLELMLRAYMSNGADAAKDIITTTLDAMCSGGMYDHIGGGFARYSVDREWLVPHFEKMLYDQALLCKTYLHGLIVLGNQQWRQVLGETVGYVLTTLQHPDGGFYSAEDADSLDTEGNSVEGAFYTWTPDEVRAAMHDVKPAIVDATMEWYNISDEGNWEERPGRSIPNRMQARGVLRRPKEIDYGTFRLAQARQQRPRPGLDDKVLTEWNAMFLATLAEAAAVFNNAEWKAAAIRNGEFLLRELRGANGRWNRSWHADGKPQARHDALAGDHAALVDAFTRLAECTGEARWITAASETADTMLDFFWDPVHGGLYTTAEDAEELIVRQKDLRDAAMPSANSTAAVALYRLAALTGEQRYANQADRIMHLLNTQVDQGIGQYSNALIAADLRRRGTTEVVIVGDRPDILRMAQSIWRPDTVLAWGEPYDSPLWAGREEGFAYVCRDHTCQLPQDTVEGFSEMLTGKRLSLPGSPTVSD